MVSNLFSILILLVALELLFYCVLLFVSYILKYAATLNFSLEKDELIDMIKFTAIVQLLINITIVICGVYMIKSI